MEDIYQNSAPRTVADLEDNVPVGMADSGWDYKCAETSRPQGAYGGLVFVGLFLWTHYAAITGIWNYPVPGFWFRI